MVKSGMGINLDDVITDDLMDDKPKDIGNKEYDIGHMNYDIEILNKAMQAAKAQPMTGIYSIRIGTIFQYLRRTQPMFSVSEEAGALLEEALEKKYPELYEIVEDLLELESNP